MAGAFLFIAGILVLVFLGLSLLRSMPRRKLSMAFTGPTIRPQPLQTPTVLHMQGKRWQTDSGRGIGSARRTGMTKAEAEDLLDWLEAHDRPAVQVSYKAGEGFSVQW